MASPLVKKLNAFVLHHTKFGERVYDAVVLRQLVVADVRSLVSAARLRYFRRLYTGAPQILIDLLIEEDEDVELSWFALWEDLRWPPVSEADLAESHRC